MPSGIFVPLTAPIKKILFSDFDLLFTKEFLCPMEWLDVNWIITVLKSRRIQILIFYRKRGSFEEICGGRQRWNASRGSVRKTSIHKKQIRVFIAPRHNCTNVHWSIFYVKFLIDKTDKKLQTLTDACIARILTLISKDDFNFYWNHKISFTFSCC